MEQKELKKAKKKDKKPVYILLGFLLFFGGFVYFLIKPSQLNKVISQIQVCRNVKDVQSIFEKHQFDFLENNESGEKVIAQDFQTAIRNKLNSFNLTDQEISNCLEWLPPAKTNINIIVVPDLSRRIIDTLNNPNQINSDIFVLNTIWKSFVNFSKKRSDTKDRLMIQVTDIDQAKGQFEIVANQLQIDLSTHVGKSNRLFFSEAKENQFKDAIKTMYQIAIEKPLGADYLLYFRRHLINQLKKSTLFENYSNKVIIITDGYLEAEDRPADTKLTPQLYKFVPIGNIKEMITKLGLNIPRIDIDLSNTDILVCELNERKTGKAKDFEILKAYWEDWLSRMNAHKVSVIQKEQATYLTEKKIETFLEN